MVSVRTNSLSCTSLIGLGLGLSYEACQRTWIRTQSRIGIKEDLLVSVLIWEETGLAVDEENRRYWHGFEHEEGSSKTYFKNQIIFV